MLRVCQLELSPYTTWATQYMEEQARTIASLQASAVTPTVDHAARDLDDEDKDELIAQLQAQIQAREIDAAPSAARIASLEAAAAAHAAMGPFTVARSRYRFT